MALIDKWLQNRLENYAGITALVGTKVYPMYAPQSAAYPFVTFRRSNTERNYKTGTTPSNDGVPRTTFEIHCWDDDYGGVKDLSNHVRLAIDGYRQDASGFVVRRAFIEDEADVPEPPDWGGEQPIYGVRFVLEVAHTETVPTY